MCRHAHQQLLLTLGRIDDRHVAGACIGADQHRHVGEASEERCAVRESRTEPVPVIVFLLRHSGTTDLQWRTCCLDGESIAHDNDVGGNATAVSCHHSVRLDAHKLGSFQIHILPVQTWQIRVVENAAAASHHELIVAGDQLLMVLFRGRASDVVATDPFPFLTFLLAPLGACGHAEIRL